MDRLLILSDDPGLFSGLARCVRELTVRLKDKYELAVAGWHHNPIRHSFPFHIYPLIKGDPQEGDAIYHILSDFKPKKLLCIGDLWDFHYIQNPVWRYRGEQKKSLETYLWCTPDGEWTQYRWEEILQNFDRIASFSKFGSDEIGKMVDAPCKIIYPGVDCKQFIRPDRLTYEASSIVNPEKTFVALTVAQNTSRKNLAAGMEAFRDFNIQRSNSHYILVTNPLDPNGTNLVNIARWLGLLQRRCISFLEQNPREGISDEKLLLAFCMSHAHILSTIGEGAALPIFESMAMKVVNIATNYSAIPEIIGDRGLLADVSNYLFGAYDVRRAVVSVESITKHLITLYDDWAGDRNLMTTLQTRGRDFAEAHTWEKTSTEILDWLEMPIADPSFVVVSKPKRPEILMAIPTHGKACGIAEYTHHLDQALERLNIPVMVYPSADLMMLPKLHQQKPFGILHIQHEFSFYPDRFLLEKALREIKKLGVKVIVTMHSSVRHHAYNQMITRLADRIILHHDVQQEIFLDGMAVSSIRVVPMGCGDPHALDGIEARRAELGITSRSPIIGSFGFLRDQKGFHEIALATKLLRESHPDILFLLISPKHIFGSDAYDEKFYRFIRDQGLGSQIMIYREFLPEDQILKTLQCADLFVMNYQNQPDGGGLSAAIKTVMRTQRPIIASKCFAFSDLNREVIWLGKQEPQVIAESIEALLANPGLGETAVQASNTFLTKHRWDKVARIHEEIYHA